MKVNVCVNCGGNEFIYKEGAMFCKYCNTRYSLEENEKPRPASVVSIDQDIDLLLAKCKAEPSKADRYARLILDIDPTNKEAQKYVF
jgi:uncharacterized Zn finger protein (UPF0148 family)